MNGKTFIMAEAEFSLVVLLFVLAKNGFLEEQGWRKWAIKAMKPRLTGEYGLYPASKNK